MLSHDAHEAHLCSSFPSPSCCRLKWRTFLFLSSGNRITDFLPMESPPCVSDSRGIAYYLIEGISFFVFAILDILDQMLCPVFALIDSLFDAKSTSCYCHRTPSRSSEMPRSFDKNLSGKTGSVLENLNISSATVYADHRRTKKSSVQLRHLLRSLSRQTADIMTTSNACGADTQVSESESPAARAGEGIEHSQCEKMFKVINISCKPQEAGQHWRRASARGRSDTSHAVKRVARWSDCGCNGCTSWQVNDQLLHVHIDDKDFVASVGIESQVKKAENNIIFLHGFLASSSFWADTVMPALPECVRSSHRLFAADILGFGRSPKPSDSLYTIPDHVNMISRSLLEPYGVQKFHIVAHSMGCTIALALAAQFPAALKSITLIAPPYFPEEPGAPEDELHVMHQMAPRKVWPLLKFGSAVMSWYEHIGRVVCFFLCRNHRIWDPLLRCIHSKTPGQLQRVPWRCVQGIMQHTHHSAWHIFHNTICSGVRAADGCFKVLMEAGHRVRVIHGICDSIIPFEGSVTLSQRYPNVHLTPVADADHADVVFGREKELADELTREFTF